MDRVLEPAIHYAEHGHPAVERVGATVEAVRELFTTEWTTSAPLYLPGLLLSIVITVVLLLSGIWYFRRMERTFADVI